MIVKQKKVMHYYPIIVCKYLEVATVKSSLWKIEKENTSTTQRMVETR